VFWELELKQSADESMYEILTAQKARRITCLPNSSKTITVNWLKNPDSPTTPVNVTSVDEEKDYSCCG
jgi:hypothetical protein